MHKSHVLIVDDENVVRESLAEWLASAGHETSVAESGEEALALIGKRDFDILIADLKMAGIDGIELLAKVKALLPNMPVVIMTAYGSVASAIEAMKAGAYDYIEKPFCPERVELLIEKVMTHLSVVKENAVLKRELRMSRRIEDLIGKSRAMQRIFELIRVVAKSNATVLVQGETGTGKELVARAVHAESLRNAGPFVSLNCAALPESLLESELFGHEKGAFTGAVERKEGKFEIAHQGTIFLDEIGDISPNIQLHLLRVIQEREFTRVGGNETVAVDVRIVTSTNRDLQRRIAEGTFREDLYYRLNVVPILIPPLRERTEDIPFLARYFLRKYNQENGKSVEDIAPDVMEFFMRYPWPGNVRELENMIEYGVVISQTNNIRLEHLPDRRSANSAAEDVATGGRTLAEEERRYMLKILIETDWNLTQSAQILGISRSTLHNKIKAYQIAVPK